MIKPRRALPAFRTIRLAIGLVMSSGRRSMLLILAATIVTSGAIAGQLLVGRTLLNLLADDRHTDAGDLAPYLAALGALLMASALAQAVAGELRLPLGEQVHRRAMNGILDVATEVELEAYEGSDFHDRLQRARLAAGEQSSAVVFGLVTLMSTLVVTVGVVAVLLAVVPALVPLAVLGYLPIAFVNVRNNRARYAMEAELTELQRDRTYLEYLMSDRAEAQEVRALDIASTLRSWHGGLWDARLAKLRTLVKRRLTLSVVGVTVTTAVLVATLSFAFILAARGSITIGDAAVAIVGLQQLSGRLQSAGSAASSVHEGVTFLRDFEAFRATLPVIRGRRPTGVPPTPPSVITVDNLGYRYPGAPVDALNSVSFEVRRGQIVAVVGANGSGKTTMAKLLGSLLAPTRGAITWDGVDIATCDPSLIRAQIAPVFQDYAKYLLTIRRAIGLGDAQPTRGRGGALARGRVERGSTRSSRLRNSDSRRGWASRSRTGSICRSDSGSGWRSPGRCFATRPSSCSTSRRPRSTLVRSPTCSTCSTRCVPTESSSSCRTVSQRSGQPTSSW